MSTEEDKDIEAYVHWYELMKYLEKDESGAVAKPWVLVKDAPDWCPGVLEGWKRRKAKGFKVP